MSIQYDKEIFSNERVVLKANFSGIRQGIANATDLTMSFYAYDKNTGQPIFSEQLNIEQVRELYYHLNQISLIKDSSNSTSGKFIETTDEVLEILNGLKSIDPEILKLILDKLNEDEKIIAILESLSDVELEHLSAAHKQKYYQTEITNLEHLLSLEETGDIVEEIKNHENLAPYTAGQPEKIFQNWIEKNLWVFGVEYTEQHDARKIALFSEGDLLMESLDGFLDLIELKRPKYGIFQHDTSHSCYYPTTDLSKVIGQCLFYLQKLDDYKLILEKEYKVKILCPRIKIIAGRTNDFNDDQFNALRILNSNLSHIQIISYDYLVSCGKKIISTYE